MLASYNPKIAKTAEQELMKAQKKYISQLEYLLSSGQTMTPKTIQWKIKKAKEMQKELMRDYEREYGEHIGNMFRGTIEDVFMKEFKSPSVNWNAISKKEFERLKKGGLEFMHNYEDTMIKRVKSELYLSFLNGESYTDAYKRIKAFGNERARPRVMIRDQMERVYQSAIIEAYGASGNPEDYLYYWVGPDDERTTEICDERKKKNPYTWEQVKKMDSHPHIQCRHRWVSEKNKEVEQIAEEKVVQSEKPLTALESVTQSISGIKSISSKDSAHSVRSIGIDAMKEHAKNEQLTSLYAKYLSKSEKIKSRAIKLSYANRPSSYDPTTHEMSIDKLATKERQTRSFVHESGHLFDNMLAKTSTGDVSNEEKALSKFRDIIKKTHSELETADGRRKLRSIIKNYGAEWNIPNKKVFVGNDISTRTAPVQDAISVVYRDLVKWGHSMEYWQLGEEHIYAEIFAGCFEILIKNDEDVMIIMDYIFPGLLSAFKEGIKSLTGVTI